MSLETYKILHIVGLLFLFLGFGAMYCAGPTASAKLGYALHGIGALIMLVAGFGLLARNTIEWPWPTWVIGKVIIWALLAAMPFLVKRKMLPMAAAWFVVLVLGGAAAWLAVTRLA